MHKKDIGQEITEKNTRDYRLDFIRYFAALLVVYAHLVNSATFAPNIYGFDLYFNNVSYPILDYKSHFLWKFDVFLSAIKLNSGVFGVILFFLVSGYLMYDIQQRYSLWELLVNRLFRVYPAAISACILILIISYMYNGKGFSWLQIITSLTLTQDYCQQLPMLGIFWTLLIEIKFYILSAIVVKWTEKKIFLTAILILCITYIHSIYGNENFILNLLAYSGVFFNFFLLGLLFRIYNPTMFIIVFLITSFSFKFYPVNEYTVYSIFITLLVFYFFIHAEIFEKLGKLLKFFADTTYSLYLLHLPIGGAVYYSMQNYNINLYLKVVITFTIVSVFSYFHYILIEKQGVIFGKKIIQYLRKK